MTLVNCPECGNEISDKALMCPHCGYAVVGGFLSGYEYRSESEFFGLPLVHIVIGYGINPMTGRIRVAKGIIAIGPIALGMVALGGLAFGAISIGGLAIGLLLAFGGLAVGSLAFGGLAIGLVAVGGAAVGYYALGGAAFGAHRLGANAQDPEAVDFFKRYLGSWVEQIQKSSQNQ